MSLHPSSSIALPACAWSDFASAVRTTLLICLMVGATPVKGQQPSWTVTGSLGTPRSAHTSTLLANGKVLVAGGSITISTTTSPYWIGIGSAELYDPATGAWSPTGSLNSPRGSHMAVRLSNGKVLVVGGDNGYNLPVTTAEIYDPDTGAWSVTGNPSITYGVAILLANDRVLVTGGGDATLYDPSTGSWSQSGTMNAPRSAYTATLLPDGKVLAAGGYPASRSAELYDPATERWTVTGSLLAEHLWDHVAALLPNGKVLVAGGGISGDDYCNGLKNAELYDLATGQWSLTDSLISTRNDYYDDNNATLLPNGKVLVVGGAGPGCVALNSSELYDPVTESWSVSANMNMARVYHTVTLLSDGKVLVAGGTSYGLVQGEIGSAELFDSGTPVVTPPGVVGVSPGAGSGLNQTFTFTVNIPSGAQNLGVLNVLINNALDGRQACYLAYVPSGLTAGALLLVNDAGAAGGPFQTLALPGAGAINNSQCNISGTGSSVSRNGNILTLTLATTFSASFEGNKVMYMAARDTAQNNSGWQALGVWNVPGAAPLGPAVSGVSPARGNTASQTYTFTFTDTNGYQDLSILNVLVNQALDGRNACYVAYIPSGTTTGTLLLVNDAGSASGPFQVMALPGSGTISNSQCTISGVGSSAAGNGNILTLTLPITFSKGFRGNRVIYAATRTNTLTSNWQAIGSTTVP